MSNILRIAVVVVILSLMVEIGSAATLTVNASGGAMYTKIQDAVNAASSEDTIIVYAGTYYENVNINKQVMLKGSGMPIIDGRKIDDVVKIFADGVIMNGFNVQNSTNTPGVGRVGIYVISNNNILRNNSASNNGWGFYLTGSTNTLSNNTANFNDLDGIYLSQSNNNNIYNNTAMNNYQNGIDIYASSNNTLLNNKMQDNLNNFLLTVQRNNANSQYDNNIDTSNTVNGKPIYYLKNAANSIYDSSSNAGTFYCISCNNITIKNLDFSNNAIGISFWNTINSKVMNINSSNNSYYGFYLDYSDNNIITNNNFTNGNYGILQWTSNNNVLQNNTVNSNSQIGIYLIDS